MTHPVVEGANERFAPRSPEFRALWANPLIRRFNRSVSELALGGNGGGIRPRANSLQDDRLLKSPSGKPALEDHIAMRSLPTPGVTPSSFGGLGSGKPLNVEALPFVPPPGLETPPTESSEDTPTTVSPSTPDPSPIVEPIQETRSPFPHPERRGSISSISSVPSTPSTVKPSTAVTTTIKPGPPPKWGYTRCERRAVETVINVLLEMKSKGEVRASPGNLPPLILAKDRKVYRNVGNRANRFWKLIELGVQMGWLEIGPENAWIDVGKGWTEDIGL